MANIKLSQFPTVTESLPDDLVFCDQAGVSVAETVGQIIALGLQFTVLNYPGSPISFVSGVQYQLCIDTVNNFLYYCSTPGDAPFAVWTLLYAGAINLAYAGNPNGSVAGVLDQLCIDTSNNNLFYCSVAGNTSTTVWTAFTPTLGIVPVTSGGTGVDTLTGIVTGNGTSNFTASPITQYDILSGGAGNSVVSISPSTTGYVLTSNGIAAPATFQALTGQGVTWVNQTTASVTMTPSNGYIINSGSQCALTLPTTVAIGTFFAISGYASSGWVINQNSGQTIHCGSGSTTTGTAGHITSSNRYDAILIICSVANTDFTILQVQGNPTGS